jgi:imidazole glycerol-phosphate synthase subunit HisH
MIAIVDYGVGNLGSIKNMLDRLGFESKISSHINDIKASEKLILPGVGHFDHGMKSLENSSLVEVLNEEVIQKCKPILGICLGAQLMARNSEEGNRNGLGWFDASVVKFHFNDKSLKIPHMGWNYVEFNKYFKLISNDDSIRRYYFVHSYHFKSNDNNITMGISNYGYKFPAILSKDNIYAVQFHPEKSHKYGMELLKGFASL